MDTVWLDGAVATGSWGDEIFGEEMIATLSYELSRSSIVVSERGAGRIVSKGSWKSLPSASTSSTAGRFEMVFPSLNTISVLSRYRAGVVSVVRRAVSVAVNS